MSSYHRENGESGADHGLENEVSLSADLSLPSSGNNWKDRVLYVVFRLLKLMTENQKVNSTSKLLEVILLVLDWAQVVQLLVSPVFGWHEETFGWASNISVVSIILPPNSPTAFVIAYAGVLVVAWLSLLNAIYVGWDILNESYKSIWPLKTLRALVSIVLTAGFIPIMTILSIPFDCSNLSTFLGEVSCSEFPMVLFKVSSIITLIVFVPFALLTSLVYFDDNPNSSLPTAKPIGRLDFYDTMMRSVLTLAVVLLRKEAVLLSLLTFLMLLFLASFLNVTLPFFKMWMNRMRSIMYLILLWLSLGTVIVSIGKISGSSLRTFSIAWMAVAILPGLTGMQLPRIRYRWLFKLSWKIGNQLKYDEEMMRLGITDAAAQAFSPHELYEKRRKFRGSKYRLSNTTMTDLLSPPSRSKIHKEDRINQWASSDRSRTVDRLGGDDAGKEQKDEDVSKSVNAHSDIMSSDSQNDRYPLAEIVKRYFILEYDIELMVRALLENPTRENFKQATVVLNAALTSFPESVFVRIVYAYLILTYSNNSTRAVKLLKEAQRLEAPLDLRFLLFSKIHAWNQIRQHESMGTGKDMVSAIQFKKKINEARENHVLTIRKITKFWELLRSEDETDRGSIATVLEEIYEAREKARATYCELLGEYPSNKHVAYSYGLFCLFVLNDESKAEAYLNKSRIDQDEETRHPVEGSIVGSKHPSTVAGGGGAPQFQWRVKCEEFHTLHRIKVWFRTSVVLLFLLTLGTFITSIVLLKNFENTNKSIYYSGKARMSIQDTWCFSRNMHLGAAAKKRTILLNGTKNLGRRGKAAGRSPQRYVSTWISELGDNFSLDRFCAPP
eukprot:gb/GECG01000287.1/.p1 GENE.gb/GECG01000287.1/~~gb/GECG01000287.1/.p1  ORF type:complete len:839 (+),score=87.28 gb/GECG01000287.1/:1-2517(+)